jgi:hypothetical protein
MNLNVSSAVASASGKVLKVNVQTCSMVSNLAQVRVCSDHIVEQCWAPKRGPGTSTLDQLALNGGLLVILVSYFQSERYHDLQVVSFDHSYEGFPDLVET